MKTLRVLAVLALVSCETPPPAPPPPSKESLLDLVENQNTDKVRERFGLNEDVNSVNAQGQTALHVAAAKDLADIAAVLLARGADVDKPDSSGLSPLHLAVLSGSSKVLPVLAQYGASLFSSDKQGRSVLQTALQQNPDLIPLLVTKNNIGSRDKAGNTLLHLAAAQGLEGLADVLIQRGADESARNAAGLTALTTPHVAHWVAGSRLPAKMTCLARVAPMRCTSRWTPPAIGNMPTPASTRPILASSAAQIRSQARASSNPPPRQ